MKKISDNRWHFSELAGKLSKTAFVEWKYFNFTSPECSGIFVYFIADPENKTGAGGAKIVSKIFAPDGKIFGAVEKIPAAEVFYSGKGADIKIKNNFVKVSKNDCQIFGEAGGIGWNLRFKPKLPPVSGFSDLPLDPLNLEKASWLIQMPSAEVKGTVKFAGRERKISAVGYSDANWGSFLPLILKFNWCQFSDENLSVVVGESENFEIAGKKFGRWGKISADYEGESVVFNQNEFSITHLEWDKLAGSRLKIPTASLIEGENENYKISLKTRTLFSELIHFEMPLHFPIMPAVAEQTALFEGALFKKEKGEWKLSRKIENKGFKEFAFRDILL